MSERATVIVCGAVGNPEGMTNPAPPPSRQSPASPSTPPAGQPAAPAKETKGRNLSVGQILAGILLVLVFVFIVENSDQVKIRIIAGPKVQMPVYLALMAAAVVGALIAALMRYRRHHRNRA